MSTSTKVKDEPQARIVSVGEPQARPSSVDEPQAARPVSVEAQKPRLTRPEEEAAYVAMVDKKFRRRDGKSSDEFRPTAIFPFYIMGSEQMDATENFVAAFHVEQRPKNNGNGTSEQQIPVTTTILGREIRTSSSPVKSIIMQCWKFEQEFEEVR